MAQTPHTTLVTGANRGIDFAIVQALATKYPNARYLLASRSILSGQIALQQLKELGISTENVHLIELDVSNEESIKGAEARVRTYYGRLDDPINNAGIAICEAPDHSDLQSSYTETFNTNIMAVALMMTHFLPLLKASSPEDARIVNISSARASLQLSSTGNLPPSQVIAYSVSKTALNALTLEYAKGQPAVWFYAASPGHCKTAFNGYKGTKDPLDGARVVVELATAEKGKYGNGLWELEGEEGECSRVPW